MKKTLKISIFDEFSCIADKCRFTCCSGWEINVDSNTYNNLKINNINFVTKEIIEKDSKYFIKKDIEKDCPFLDKIGLCEIVKSVGAEYLSKTCRDFPRLENSFDDFEELSLSCACPEVVDIIERNKQNMMFDEDLKSSLNELRIRNKIIEIIRQKNLSIEKRLIISYKMLEEMLDNKNIDNIIGRFNESFIKEVGNVYDEIEIDEYEGIEEVNSLFIDIIENYKDVKILKKSLDGIYNFADEFDFEVAILNLRNFKQKFDKHNDLIEECLVAKVLSFCVNEDIKELIVAFELIILEYVLIRYAVMLKSIKNGEPELQGQDIKDYIVIFSRIVSNNAVAIREFIRDGFGSEILECGYLSFISLF
ncbi:MAG: flagellin lysine-N-methylase [Sarcina sp.]